jgi:hypothetical protein
VVAVLGSERRNEGMMWPLWKFCLCILDIA